MSAKTPASTGPESTGPAAPDTAAPRVVVLDHGSGNVRSVVRALEAAGADVALTADREQALEAVERRRPVGPPLRWRRTVIRLRWVQPVSATSLN